MLCIRELIYILTDQYKSKRKTYQVIASLVFILAPHCKIKKCSASQNVSSSQPAFTCSKLTKEILEQGVKYVQS